MHVGTVRFTLTAVKNRWQLTSNIDLIMQPARIADSKSKGAQSSEVSLFGALGG